jgi:hypothetical protein
MFASTWPRGDPIFDSDLPAFRIIDIPVFFLSSWFSCLLGMKMRKIGQVAVISHNTKHFVKK